MVRVKPQDVEEEVQKQEDEFYGDETASGSNPRPTSDDDVTSVYDDAVGYEEQEEEPEEVGIAGQVEEDEEARWQKESPEENLEE